MRSVIIIGAGPAGLTAARILRAAGIKDLLVVERDEQAGGLPRHCGHHGFGVLDFRHLWTGPRYIRELCDMAKDVEIATDETVIAVEPGGRVRISGTHGVENLAARTVLLATGIRETPRSARLVSGTRPYGITTTGAFQEMVYTGGFRPFSRPVIVGTELVAFSALLTARHLGIRPAAMIEENDRITAGRFCDVAARRLFGTPVLTSTRLVEIQGRDRVGAVVVERQGKHEAIACDGVVFSGRFVPEATLARGGHLAVDLATGGPVIDNFWRCSDPAYFAAGNVLRAVEHSGMVSREASWAAAAILRGLAGDLPAADNGVPVRAAGSLLYVYPQRIIPHEGARIRLYARTRAACRGRLRLTADGREIAARFVNALPERRLTLDAPSFRLIGSRSVELTLEASR